MLATAAQTLDYCAKEFGAYPHKQLKLVEVPSSAFGGFAFPDTIVLSEGRSFLIDSRDANRPDLVARRVAHEVSHQWWGHQLVAANRGGSSLLTESLAKYTELMILERQHGRDAVRQLLEYELDRYLAGRAGEEQRERTLANVGDQPYVYYSKGALVLYAIRDLLGEHALNRALRALVAEKRDLSDATSADLVRHLHTVADARRMQLIESWLQKIILYDVRIEAATVTPLPDRTFRIDARVIGSRYEASADGTEREVPLDESIELAAYRVAGIAGAETIGSQPVHLHSGVNTVSMIVKEKPSYVAVDPWLLRIDRNRFDNGKRLDGR
jgi:ABC-2 type transport system permease protein